MLFKSLLSKAGARFSDVQISFRLLLGWEVIVASPRVTELYWSWGVDKRAFKPLTPVCTTTEPETFHLFWDYSI